MNGTTGAIWRAQLTPEERAVLGRADGEVAGARPDVLVVGRRHHGRRHRRRLRSGRASARCCSSRPAGWAPAPPAARPACSSPTRISGVTPSRSWTWSGPAWQRWRDLEAGGARRRRPGRAGLARAGPALRAASPPHQPRAVQWLNPGQVDELIPGLARPMEGALIRRQGRVNPLRALARLAAGLPAVATGVAATGVTVAGEQITEVVTSAGTVSPGAVVFATGWPPVLDGLAVDIPADRVKGHLLVTEPTPVRLPGIVAPVATQIEDGRLLAGGTFDVGDETPAVQPEVIEAIMDSLAAVAARAARPGRGLAVVLLPAAAPRPAAGDRPGPGPGQRLADLGAFPHRDPERPGHRGRAGPVDLRRRAARGARHLVSQPFPGPPLRPAGAGAPAARPGAWRRSSGSRSVIPARSRYSSSGIAIRRVVPRASRASAAVNGCGSPARMQAAASAAPGASTICSLIRSSSPARSAAAMRADVQPELAQPLGVGRGERRAWPGRPAGSRTAALHRPPAAPAPAPPAAGMSCTSPAETRNGGRARAVTSRRSGRPRAARAASTGRPAASGSAAACAASSSPSWRPGPPSRPGRPATRR